MGECARETQGRLLTDRQQQFIAEYLECRQIVKAALRAGYSTKTAHHSSWRLLHNPQIRQKIDAGLAAARQRQARGRDDVVAELERVAFSVSDQEDAPVRTADKLRALDLLARIMGLYGARNRAEEMPDIAEQLRRARLRVERMKKEDEETKKEKQEKPQEIAPLMPENPPVSEVEAVVEPAVKPRAKDIPFSMIMGRHPESPFPLDPAPSGHTGWQNFEFDPYEY